MTYSPILRRYAMYGDRLGLEPVLDRFEEDPQYRPDESWIMVEEIAQALGQGKHQLSYGHLGKHMVHEARGVGNQEIMPAPPAAGARAKPWARIPQSRYLRRPRSTKRGMGSRSGSASRTRASQVSKFCWTTR